MFTFYVYPKEGTRSLLYTCHSQHHTTRRCLHVFRSTQTRVKLERRNHPRANTLSTECSTECQVFLLLCELSRSLSLSASPSLDKSERYCVYVATQHLLVVNPAGLMPPHARMQHVCCMCRPSPNTEALPRPDRDATRMHWRTINTYIHTHILTWFFTIPFCVSCCPPFFPLCSRSRITHRFRVGGLP